jgi:flagellar biosynthetic protein FliR
MDLGAFLTSQVMAYVLVFARLGSVMMFMPGFGETQVPVRMRLMLALVLCAALLPATPVGPMELDTPLALLPVLAIEITLGLWIGLTARILMTALQFAGYQIGMVSGLANAFAPGMGSFQGATLVASALMMAAVALIFVTDLHHVILRALLMSYEVFPVGRIMPGDLAEQIVRAAGMSLYLGVSLAAPFYVLGLLLNVGLGLANRMMPSLPVFFIASPVLIAAGLFVLVAATPSILRGYLEAFTGWLGLLAF